MKITKRQILAACPKALNGIELAHLGPKSQGKVRDFYIKDGKRILITTDRQSAFDVILGDIPFKGAVLNQLTQFWLGQTQHIVPNHMIFVPDPNVMIAKNCQTIPIEMIVRGYISGVTKTSIWASYAAGERTIYGIKFPEGLKKNQQLPEPIITPTSHAEVGGHDERLTREEILQSDLVDPEVYRQMEEAAIALFKFGSQLAQKQGLILVDTKYEFGLYEGQLTLIDEIHTPDSSRFWNAKTYQEHFEKGLEPENFDKEFLRLWYAERGYTGDGEPPQMPQDLILALAQRYVQVYETLTEQEFISFDYPIEQRIKQNLEKVFC
jgi:phosphoribosylaminoimidazole-succinocarboxamide synthase